MRFKLTLEVNKTAFGNILPINYQYEQSALIYRILGQANLEYSTWLHDNGFELESGKRFKLFTFSRFKIEKRRILPEERLQVLCNTVEWQISFLPEKSTEKFIQGLFVNQVFEIGDKKSRVQFHVQNIEILPNPIYKEKMCFNTMSPMCISVRDGSRTKDYLSLADPKAKGAILNGLMHRYQAVYGKSYVGNLNFDIILLNEPKPVLIKIKADTKEQTKVKGYMCKFEVQAPVELMKIGYESGWGEEGSVGFGCLEEMEK
ncbi:MAG: CRISPR-associated endoribonuclease Cas6 [Bacteroidales bacterium]